MRKHHFFILIVTAAWAAVCFLRISAFQDPSGGDGYFYLKQIEWLSTRHQFYHADYSFIFLPLVLLFKITGSSLLCFQILNIFCVFAMSSALGLLFMQRMQLLSADENLGVKTQRVFLGSAFALGIATQQATLKLSFEFLKSGFAQALILLGIYFYFENRRRTALAFLLFASLSHKLAALFLAFVFIVHFFKKEKKFFAVAAVIVAALTSVLFIFPRFFNHFEDVFANLSFEDEFFMKSDSMVLGRLQIVLGFIWLVMGFLLYRKIKDKLLLAMMVFSVIPFMPFFGGENIEIKYRLFLLSFTFAAAAFALTWPLIQNVYLKRQLLVLSFAFLAFQATQTSGFPWVVPWSERIQNLDRLTQIVRSAELVTHHSLQFYIDYKTPIRARSLLAPNRQPKYQIAYVPEFYHLNPHLSDEIRQIQILSLGSTYALFEFEDFQNLMKQYPMLSDWRNVFQTRPDFVQDY